MGFATSGHVIVIDPAVHTPELDCFNKLSISSPLPCTYHLPSLHGFASLESEGPSAKGIVVLGSSSSVLENRDWQITLGNWLKQRSGIPMLGICFGHQLFAHLYGGSVDFMYTDNRKLSGFREIEISPSPLWGNKTRKGLLTVSHREAVMSCPADMQVLAKSAEIPIEGLAHKTLPIWTLQAHPEATRDFLKNMHIDPPSDPDALTFGQQLIADFLKYCVQTK